MAVISLDGIGKSYGLGADVLHNVTLSLAAGDFCFVTGAHGAGKTTLMHIIALAEQPLSGRLMLFDTDVLDADRAARAALRRRIGIVFQDLRLLDHLSVADNIGLPLRIAGARDANVHRHVYELAGWLGIGHRIDAAPPALSPGERQRVALARAIVHRPELLLADEPTGGVDNETAAALMRVFEQLNRLGATVVIATRDLALARQSGHLCVHLDRGCLANAERGAAA